MIHSLFIINGTGDIFMEKHWKSVINRSICDYFFEAQHKCAKPEDIPTVISTPHHKLILIYRNKLYFVAVVVNEVSPLFVIEILHRAVDIFEDYFNECNETSLKENFVIVYELLDEMLDNGFPLATEVNILKELIKPPTVFRKMANMVTGDTNISSTLPTVQLSNIPWRKQGIKYTNNEAYFDCIEELDAIIDKNGSTIMCEIKGYIDCCIKLSGMPDLTLCFSNPRLLDDVSFHPCVRFKRWENEKVLSFVPPDGNFRLISYHIESLNSIQLPVYVRHSIQYREGSNGKFEVTIGPRSGLGKIVENASLHVEMPKSVLNMSLTPSQGKYTFDSVKKTLNWEIGRIDPAKIPNIRGNITLQNGATIPESNPPLHVNFSISQITLSGIKFGRLDIYGEKYKPFKGVKYVTKAGKFQIRT
jgi:AP-3 complex subunit mu